MILTRCFFVGCLRFCHWCVSLYESIIKCQVWNKIHHCSFFSGFFLRVINCYILIWWWYHFLFMWPNEFHIFFIFILSFWKCKFKWWNSSLVFVERWFSRGKRAQLLTTTIYNGFVLGYVQSRKIHSEIGPFFFNHFSYNLIFASIFFSLDFFSYAKFPNKS